MERIAVLFYFVFVALALFSPSLSKKVEIGIYELKKGDFSVKFTNYGARIISVVLPDKEGKLADVVLGFDSIAEYMNDTQYVGPITGRVGNRIGGAKFSLNGTTYKLVANEGNNTLHGGRIGFSEVIWGLKTYQQEGHSPYITFTYRSFDGEQGFPGDLMVSVTYMLIGKDKMSVKMKAKALNKATPVSLLLHTYWNLGGHNSGDILSNTVQIFGSRFTQFDNELIPTGKILSVKGTPYDFLKPQKVGNRINQLPIGYDINYVLDESAGHTIKKAAMVHDSRSGRVLELWTNAPGMQFYTSHWLKNLKGKDGAVYQSHAGLVLETQWFPDSVNHPNFPSEIVYPGKSYKHLMLFKFSVKGRK